MEVLLGSRLIEAKLNLANRGIDLPTKESRTPSAQNPKGRESHDSSLNIDDNESFRDSAYGTISKTVSMVARGAPLETREELLRWFLKDEEANRSFEQAAKHTEASDFEHTLKCMLVQFSRELRLQASNTAQKSAASLATRYSGYLANAIRKTYFMKEDSRAVEIERLASQTPDIRANLERLLEPISELEPDKDGLENNAPDLKDDYSDIDEPALLNLAQVEAFVFQGRAMENFRDKLRSWAQKMVEPVGHKAAVGYLSRWVSWLKKFTRPKVKPGYRRIDWQCVSPALLCRS